MTAPASRLAFIDALKAVASQLIVLHHLAFYGPMSDYAQPLAPQLIAWLSQYARIAVQVFLVIGGFLAAQAIARDGRLLAKSVPALIWRRYLKLALPYFGALLLAIAGAAIARSLITNESIPAAPTLSQLIAHVFLLQSLLDFDGLSAGVWYVAIDFQLYSLLVVSLWFARRASLLTPAAGRLLVITLMAASVFYFNRDDAWDNWALYFFGAYGLGVITFWTVRRNEITVWLPLAVAMVVAALLVDFRSRIAVALAVALALAAARYTDRIENWPKSGFVAWLGQISYSVFLVHFPICLVVNAFFERFAVHGAGIQLTGMIVAWLASVGVGALFYHQVECRAQRLLAARA
jgi:peptidoglycan/LPS O-acetylase OafA/YrhL